MFVKHLIVLLFTIVLCMAKPMDVEKRGIGSSTINFKSNRALDVYGLNNGKANPVVIFIYGGAWVSGNKSLYTQLGLFLERNNFVGVLPNYVLYPQGNVEDMVDDVYKAIKWTIENISKYGGDPSNITVSGHSAGAHLLALTMVKSSLGLSNLNIKLEPFTGIQRVVLLDGPYSIGSYVGAGSSMFTGIGSSSNDASSNASSSSSSIFKDYFKSYRKSSQNSKRSPQGLFGNNNSMILMLSGNGSPIEILQKYSNNSIKSLGAPKFNIVHCSLDTLVPKTSATGLLKEIKRTSPNTVAELHVIEGLTHSGLVTGVMAGSGSAQSQFLKLITS